MLPPTFPLPTSPITPIPAPAISAQANHHLPPRRQPHFPPPPSSFPNNIPLQPNRQTNQDSEEGEWTEVRRKRGSSNQPTTNTTSNQENRNQNSNHQVTSFLFFNFPSTWLVTDLWKFFKVHGEVKDIYMARNPLRNGQKFGFVRYGGISDAELFADKLRNINHGNGNLRVYKAKNRPNSNRYPTRSAPPTPRPLVQQATQTDPTSMVEPTMLFWVNRRVTQLITHQSPKPPPLI